MAYEVGFSDQWRRAEREEREQLRRLEARLDELRARRRDLLGKIRELTTKQREVYQRREGPQTEAERLYHESGELNRHLADLRRAVEKVRQTLEDAVVRRRELVLTFSPVERLNPEQLKREIAELELRQQTTALSLDDEKALLVQLRRKVQELKDFEARKELVTQHEAQRKELETTITTSRAEIDRIVKEMQQVRAERDKRKVDIPASLEAAGAAAAELRVMGSERAELMTQADALGREIAEIEREGRELLARHHQRQEDAREILREYARPLPSNGSADSGSAADRP